MKNDKPKKPIYKRWWFWLIIVSVVFAALSPKDKSAQPSEVVPESVLSFTLAFDDPGEYGREIVLNAGTENEYRCYGFYIPAGDYRVTFKGSKGAVQVTFCEDGINTLDNGMEELIGAEQRPIVAMAGETYNFHINDGQYVKLSDGSKQVFFEKLGE